MRASRLLLAWVATLVTACVEDPSIPCRPMSLGDAEPGTVTTPEDAPIVALLEKELVEKVEPAGIDDLATVFTQGLDHRAGVVADAPSGAQVVDEKSRVLWHLSCRGVDCSPEHDPLTPDDDGGLGGGMLLTGTGQYVLVVDQDLHSARWFPVGGGPEVEEGVFDLCPLASLRHSNHVIARGLKAGSCDDGQLLRVSPQGKQRLLPDDSAPGLTIVPGAIGEHHVVGRRRRDSGEEQLYLIPVDEGSSHWRRNGIAEDPIALGQPRRRFSRVLFTRGDEFVVATSGAGEHAVTYVFDVATGKEDTHFDGALVDGESTSELKPLKELPGVRATSPDGSHVAVRMPSGTLALHDLTRGSRCVVRNARAGNHEIAGFGSDGTLYLEASPDEREHEIAAWDSETRETRTLAAGERYRLKAAPARRGDDGASWALVAIGTSYYVVQDDEAPQHLKVHDPLPLARDDGALWLLEHAPQTDGGQALSAWRVLPDHSTMVLDDPKPIHSGDSLCMSTGTPGAWASLCTRAPKTDTSWPDNFPPSENPESARVVMAAQGQ